MAKIKTAIIGATGYIGSCLLKRYRYFFSDCIGTGFSNNQENLITFDLRYSDINELNLEETGHEAVIMAAARSDVAWCENYKKESYNLNVKAILKLAKQLEEKNIQLIFFSSDYVFDGRVGNYSDVSEVNPMTEYGKQKAEIEKELPNITSNYIILRISKVYGTIWKDNTLLDSLTGSFFKKEPITVAIDQFFSPTYIDDIVSMTIYAQEQKVRGLFNLCANNAYSRHQIAQKIANELQFPSNCLQISPLHLIRGMKNRPLNTSLKCSSIFTPYQSSFLSIDNAIKIVAKNWIDFVGKKNITNSLVLGE
jgi:dTDP-4-dehydrorhamnose reductase